MSDTLNVLRSVWSTETEAIDAEKAVVDDCAAEGSAQKTCRNMKHVTFDGMAEPGSDLGTAWREKLAREGKLGSGSLADLIDQLS